MQLVKTDNLTVRYGSRTALDGLSLDLSRGATGLLGPNGAGKSTLIKTILGFIRPHAGKAELFGIPVSHRNAEVRERLGYFPERSVFVPELSSVEMVALAGELGGLPRRMALERAHEMLWFVGLGEARYRKVADFSTGMQQRNKLAMALVHDPELLLLDEPTSGLDPHGRRQMLKLIRELVGRKISVLLSTHLLNDVEQVCERVVVLDHGRLVMDSTLSDLRSPSGWVYELRVHEEEPGRFKEAMKDHAEHIAQDKDGLLLVTMSSASTKLFFDIALRTETEIRQLRRFETSLEDQFVDVVQPEKA